LSRALRLSRALAIALGTALGFVGAGAAVIAALDRAGVSQPPAYLDVTQDVENRVAELARTDPGHTRSRVVLLGDSTSVPLPARLAARLAGSAPAPRVVPLAIRGQTTWDQYFLSDLIARAEPDVVVIALHLANFSDHWRDSFAKPEFAGWLPLARAPEALRLPLHEVGLSSDELLWYRAIVAAELAPRWRALSREQVRMGQALRDAETGFAGAVGSRDDHRALFAYATLERRVGPDRRLTRAGALDEYAAVLGGLPADHPVLAVLRALLASFRARGTPTLVAVTPANVEHLAHLGLLDDAALARSLARIESVARAQGAAFLDLHALLPDAAFSDAAGHYGEERAIDGPGLVAERLAPAVSTMLARTGR